MKMFHCFPRENNFLSLFCNIGIELYFTLICPFWYSLQVIIDFLGGSINVIYNWKNRCIIKKKSFTFDIKLSGRSFMYIKNSNRRNADPCDMPALIGSQWEFSPLSKTLWYLLSRKLWTIVINLYIRPSCQILSKAFDTSKASDISKDGKLSKIKLSNSLVMQ